MSRTPDEIKKSIESGQTALGIELGSTRIKAVLIDETFAPIAQGGHEWENRLENGIWTYSMEDIENGVRACYADLTRDVLERCGVRIGTVGAIGVSAMMHGYLAFDEEGELLVPFRTWRNTITGEAAERLTEIFGFNIPERWSIAHLYQAMLNKEEHVAKIAHITTLAGLIHERLTGERVLGVGDASGMFPIDPATGDYDERMLGLFDELTAPLGYPWRLREILPGSVGAGEYAGILTPEGAAFLDPSGDLRPGIPVCPPEGDAGTGMVATKSVAPRTGNVSAGTSAFAMVVMDRPLSKIYPEIDVVTTPVGDPVAMVHVNNCTSDINAWVGLFREFYEAMGQEADTGRIFTLLFNEALKGAPDCGGLLSYGYLSGESIARLSEGRPMTIRMPDSRMSLGDFMRAEIYGALGVLKIGLDILFKEENVACDVLTGHGGLFKTEGVAERFLAAAAGAPVSVMSTAGEGGAWGMAILAAYLGAKAEGKTLSDFLEERVFAGQEVRTVAPDPIDLEGFDRFMESYRLGLAAERAAVESLPL